MLILLSIVLIISTLWAFFQIPTVQTYFAQRAASYFSDELNTEISIDGLRIDFWNKVVLEGVYLEDQDKEQMIYLDQMSLGINAFDWETKYITATLAIDQLQLKVWRKSDEPDFNYEFIEDYFSSEDTTSSNWDFNLIALQIANSQISYHDYHYEDIPESFHEEHIELSEFNFKADDFNFGEDHFSMNIHELSLREAKGFELKQLKTEMSIDSGSIRLSALQLETEGTYLETDFQMIAPSFDAYSNYNSEVEMQATVENFQLYLPDLAYFQPALKGIEDKIYVAGDMKGTVDNLMVDDLEITLNPWTRLSGDISLRGLPELDNTFLFFEIDELNTTAQGMRLIPSMPFEPGQYLDIPKEFDQLGHIHYQGNITGYLTDFVSFGRFETDLGLILTDLSLQTSADENKYKGKLATADFDLGQFVGLKDLGQVNFDLNVNGSGFSKEALSVNAQGIINSLLYKNYRYENILLNGDLDKETFIGSFNINDENLALAFIGKIDLGQEQAESQFSLNVRKAKLAKLNLFNQSDSTTNFSFRSNIDLKGNELDNFSGTALIGDLKYADSRLNHEMEALELFAEGIDTNRILRITSTLLDASLEGVYQLKEFESLYYQLVNAHIPNSAFELAEISPTKFNFKVDFKDTKPFTEVLIPELSISEGSSLLLDYTTESNQGKLRFSGTSIIYEDSYWDQVSLTAKFIEDSLALDFKSDQSNWFGVDQLTNLVVKSNQKFGQGRTKVKWEGIGEDFGSGQLTLSNQMKSMYDVDFSFINTAFEVNDSNWSINNGNRIHLDSSTLAFQGFKLKNGYQLISIDGVASSENTDTLQLMLREIDLAFISSLLPEGTVDLKGVANGTASVVSLFDKLSLTTDLRFNKLFVNTVDIGESTIRSTWVAEREVLEVVGLLGRADSKLLSLAGEVYPLREQNSLDLVLSLDQFPMRLIQPYVVDYLSDIEGVISGDIKVDGEASKPLLDGDLRFIQSRFKVDYLNTYYTINDKLFIKPEYIGFDLIEIKDIEGNKAIATGTVFHDNYSLFNYDIGLSCSEFFCLNTTSEDNDLFYGVAHMSGTANISGYDENLILMLDLKTEKGTDFKIPLEEGVDVSSSNFLLFTNSPDYNQKLVKEETDLEGIEMTFDLDITPDAKVQIIFDEQVGDIMRTEGKGELKLEINTLGDFNIYGRYVVEKGDYLFTLQNIINKRFDLAKGSTIFWDGDPYKATLDMQAIYNLRAPLYDLFPDDSTAAYKRRIPVELELQLSNYLLSPDIGFDIKLPTADETTKQRLESVLYVNNEDINRQEMNQQVFGLLVLNRFLPSASNSTTTDTYNRGTPGINNGYEFLSNQLSNWFSRLSDQFDVGVNYRPADELNSNEVDLSLSTQIFDDRLSLDGNLGYTGQSPQQINNQNSGFIGEFTAEYKLSKDGRYRVKGFNRSVSNGLLQLNSPYTQGVGLFYREEFDTARELWHKYFRRKNK